eukprot:CAMPEP_0181308270 /NCGR_PEP_ID=MMETSP1101-20121128/11366_1 /TAXON_ID=46948 /ORGANISM="Rhodomonas abbreviata, Strain Caron Lab Isolate" /LENGTH=898 /DNA_ID=CAMNT_0023414627 /DNA_START=90 /DNA_END=2786 /DNA_ORIENTATION=-
MNAAQLREILSAAQNPDAGTRNAAEEQLKLSFAGDPANHLRLLSDELADETAPTVETRALAGLSLKNFMTSKDHAQAVKLANDWMNLNPDVRTAIKNNSITSLRSTQRNVRLAAAQVISKIATIELPKLDNQGRCPWEELMPLLLQLVVQPEPGPAGMERKEAALHTLGYVCEEIAVLQTDCLQSKSDEILTAVVAGMRVDESELSVKLAATKALSNALEFANKNFQVDAERDYVMTVICEACVSANDEVKEHAYQCLGRIAELYYDKLTQYIQTILEITLNAIPTQSDNVARQAIAFWSAVCDREFELLDQGDTTECKKFIKGASKFLVPHLLKAMASQEDGQDEDTYNRSTEAAACLSAIATTIRDDVLELVMPYIRENITQPDWHLRESAVVAFGSVMDGPDESLLVEYVEAVVERLVVYLQDPEDLVKNSAAWAINRVCEFAAVAIQPPHVTPLCQSIVETFPNSAPATAGQLCWALYHLANFCKTHDQPGIAGPNALSTSIMPLCQCLMAAGDRPDASEANLRANAYEALNAVLSASDAECAKAFVAPTMLPMLGDRLNNTFAMPVLNADDLNTKNEWQSFYCSALEVCIRQMTPEVLVAPDAAGMTMVDKFMHLFLQVFASQNTTATQEALNAVSCVCDRLEGGFERYMQSFGPILVGCIAAVQETQICWLAVQATSDIARSLDAKMKDFADPFVEVLLTVLANPEVDSQIHQIHDYIKPAIYSCIGEIALAIGEGIGKFLQYWMSALQIGVQTAAQTKGQLGRDPDNYDEDLRFYQDTLCEGLLGAYVGIVHGLKVANITSPGAIDALLNPVAIQGGCLMLIQTLADDEDKSDAVLKAAVSLIGDLAETYGPKISADLQHHAVLTLIAQAKESSYNETIEMGSWAAKKMPS